MDGFSTELFASRLGTLMILKTKNALSSKAFTFKITSHHLQNLM